MKQIVERFQRCISVKEHKNSHSRTSQEIIDFARVTVKQSTFRIIWTQRNPNIAYFNLQYMWFQQNDMKNLKIKLFLEIVPLPTRSRG